MEDAVVTNESLIAPAFNDNSTNVSDETKGWLTFVLSWLKLLVIIKTK